MGTAGVGCDFCLQEGGVGGNLLPFSVFLFFFFLSVFFFFPNSRGGGWYGRCNCCYFCGVRAPFIYLFILSFLYMYSGVGNRGEGEEMVRKEKWETPEREKEVGYGRRDRRNGYVRTQERS